MKNNSELQQEVQNAIRWEPFMHSAEIGVTAKDGIVTLSGTVDSYAKKVNAENATKNVIGVRAVAQNITVNYGNAVKKNDTQIAEDVLKSWSENQKVPQARIKLKVEDGWVNIEGDVAWKYEEDAAKHSVENLPGVRGVNSSIKIISESTTTLEKKDVESALKRNWSINSDKVKVEVEHDRVKLTGLVHSLYQKEEAGRLAWNAKGVCSVENELAVIS